MIWLMFCVVFFQMSCSTFFHSTIETPSLRAQLLISEGSFVKGLLKRRFADGRLLVRTEEGLVWSLDPKETCSWCWVQVNSIVYVELRDTSASLINLSGDLIECWNGGRIEDYF